MLLEEALVLAEFRNGIFIDAALADGDLHTVLRLRALRDQHQTKAQRQRMSEFHSFPPMGGS